MIRPRGWLVVGAVLIGCAANPSDKPSVAESTTGGVGDTGGAAEASTRGESSGSMPLACSPDLTRAPELVQSRPAEWTGFHAAGGYGGFYLAGPVDGGANRIDVQVSRIDETGAELWTARWGNTLGWDDTPSALHPVPEGIVVAGISGLYPSQEYPYTGTSFLRGYSPGGRVLWTWEDSSPSFAVIFSRREGPVVAFGSQSVTVVAPMLEQEMRVGLRFMSIDRSDGSQRARVELGDPSAEPHSAWVDEDDSTWVAATMAQGSVLLRWDGAGEPTVEASADGRLFRHAFFAPGGKLLALAEATGGGEDRLHLRRFSRSLELEQENILNLDGFQGTDLFDMSVTFGCDGAALLAGFRSQGAPVLAVDAALEQMWTVRGLGSLALGDDGTMLFAGYDEELEAPAIRQLRFP